MDMTDDVSNLVAALPDGEWESFRQLAAEGVLEVSAAPSPLHELLAAMPGLEKTVLDGTPGPDRIVYDAGGEFLQYWNKNRRKLAKFRTGGK